MIDLGTVRPGETIYIPFATYDSNDPTASVTMTGLAVTDIEIYKDGSVTQRASDAGYTLLDTDGTDFDTITGIHGISIDLADNTTAGFYAAGSQYWVVLSSITVDAGTINGILVTFRIGYPDAVINTTIATLASQTSFTLTSGPAEDDALNGCVVCIHDVASKVQLGYAVISDYTGSTKTVTLAAGTTFTAAATDNIAVYPPTNIKYISTDSTAADNLELQYDGTGLSGDTYPSTQAQLSGLSVASAAQSVAVKPAPNGFVLTTGSEVNDEDSTVALDGVRHELTDSAGTLDGYYKFDIEAGAVPVSLIIKAVVNGGNDTFGIYVNIGSSGTPSWSQRLSITGTGTATNAIYEVDLYSSDVVTDLTNEVWVRIYGTGLTTSSFDVDQILVSRSFDYQYSGYDNGSVWIDTVDGTAGTTLGYNGIASRPVDTLADALTVASSTNLDRFHVSNDSTITLASSTTTQEYYGTGWTLALGGQDISNSHFSGANSVTGTSTSASGEVHFDDCEFGNASIGNSHLKHCGIGGTLTLVQASDYFFIDCYSQVAGATSPVLDMGAAVGASNVSMRHYSGGLTVNNLAAGDVLSLEGTFGTITLNGADATVEIRGIAKSVVNNLTGSPTVNDNSIKSSIIDELTTQGDTNETALTDLQTQIGTAGAGLTDLGGMSTGMKAEVLTEVVKVLVTQMTESYAADGVAPTPAQALFLIQQALTEFAYNGTSYTVKKLDGSTTAAVMTLDDGTSPTSSTRTT